MGDASFDMPDGRKLSNSNDSIALAVLQTTQVDHERRITSLESDNKSLLQEISTRYDKLMEKLDSISGQYVLKTDFILAYEKLSGKIDTIEENRLPQWALVGVMSIISAVAVAATHFLGGH